MLCLAVVRQGSGDCFVLLTYVGNVDDELRVANAEPSLLLCFGAAL